MDAAGIILWRRSMAGTGSNAYDRGFEAAISHLRGIMQDWGDDKNGHALCTCPHCVFFRQLAGRRDGWKPVSSNRSIGAEAVREYTAGCRAAMKILHDSVKDWARMQDVHTTCTCAHCRELRLIAGKKYEAQYIL
jgi:hypothetical protein